MSVDQNKSLLLNFEKSDVTLIIGDTELPAHRSILSKRSEYFKTMFSGSFIETNFDKVTLNETNLEAFKHVLEYIYTGTIEGYLQNAKICSNEFFEVLVCARFFMVDGMSLELIEHIKSTEHVSVNRLLQYSFDYAVDDLISYCTDLIKQNKGYLSRFALDEISPSTLEYVLKLRLSAPESVIFEALFYWMRWNAKHSSSFPMLLEHIDLYILKEEQLNMLFKPVNYCGRTYEKIVGIDRTFVQNLIKQQQQKAQNFQMF